MTRNPILLTQILIQHQAHSSSTSPSLLEPDGIHFTVEGKALTKTLIASLLAGKQTPLHVRLPGALIEQHLSYRQSNRNPILFKNTQKGAITWRSTF
jgi:hypothetical protein